MTSPAAELHEAAEILAANGKPALARGIRRFLAGDVPDLESALGMKGAPGERSWRTVDAIERRDAAIRELRRRHHADQGPSAAAKAIANDLTRYECTGWARDRLADEMPAAYRGKPRGLHWRILKAGGTAPGQRRIYDIIALCSELPEFVA